MSKGTVGQFAEAVGIPAERLILQLTQAELPKKSVDDAISEEEKRKLLLYLRANHGDGLGALSIAPRKVTVNRRSTTTLRQGAPKRAGPAARATARVVPNARTITVEVRSKRTYVKRVVEDSAEERQRLALLEAERRQREESEREQARLEEERRTLHQERQKAEEQAREAEEARQKRQKEEEAARRAAEEESLRNQEQTRTAEGAGKGQERGEKGAVAGGKETKSRGKKGARETKYGRDKLHVKADQSGRRRSRKGLRPKRLGKVTAVSEHGFTLPTAPVVREVQIPTTITVGDLAQKMSIKAGELIKEMMKLGTMATINQVIDQETAALLVEELGHTALLLNENALEEQLVVGEGEAQERRARAPVATVMGHVDHGKTSLLDYIRKTRVTAGESGGITQHIGAYRVETPGGAITFLDTPGHAAFTAMRARGAQATDIVILVVAADDGVMPQTVEAIQHARAAGAPLLVAINKSDKPDAAPERVRQELASHNVVSEAWGGDVLFVEISAHTGAGIDELLKNILLQAEVLELSAPTTGPARGVVIESRLDRGRGVVVSLIVQSGLLRRGDTLLAGREYGRIRSMQDEAGNALNEAGPSTPVEVLGLSGLPEAGDDALVVDNERKAREVALSRQVRYRQLKLAERKGVSLDHLFEKMQESEGGVVHVVLKADVHGSVEALSEALEKLSTDEVRVEVVAAAVGAINESDVNLAIASGAILIGFNVRADAAARRLVKNEGVDLHYHSVIYDAIDQIKSALEGMLAPEFSERIVGLAAVREVFRSRKLGAIAGCLVEEGAVKRNSPIRVLRDSVVIFEGELESLRRFKENVAEVRAGTECGIGVKGYNDVKAGDQIEVYEKVQVERKL